MLQRPDRRRSASFQRLFVPLVAAVMLCGSDFTVAAADLPVKKLLREKVTLLEEIASSVAKEYEVGKASFEDRLAAIRGLGDGQLELCETDKERVAVLNAMLARAKDLEATAKDLYQADKIRTSLVLKTSLYRMQVQIDLVRIEAK